MSWESIGTVDTGSLPDDKEWIDFCQKWAINYIRFVCGQPPAGVELDIMQNEHELGDYPSIGVWSDFYDAEYVGECERALESLNNAIDWYTLKKVYETSTADAEDEYFDDEDDEDEDGEEGEDPIEPEKDGSDLSIVSDGNHSTNEVLAGEVGARDGFYGTWRTDEIQCSECDWKGKGEQCVQGEMFKELFELDCPNCSRRLMAIPYPTIEESRANWDRVSEEDKRQVEAREEFLGRARETMPTSPRRTTRFGWRFLVLRMGSGGRSNGYFATANA